MKKFIAVALVAFFAVGASAQMRYGLEGGLNLSSPMNADGTRCGFNVGGVAEYEFQSGWFVSGALKLSSKPFKVEETIYTEDDFYDGSGDVSGEVDACVKMNPFYLNIPIHAGYRMALTDNVKLSVSAGPYIGIGLWGKGTGSVKISGNLPSDVEIESETQKIDNVFKDGNIRRFEIGVGVKAGLEFMDHYRVSLGYDIQCNSLAEDDDYYNQVVSVSVGYMF